MLLLGHQGPKDWNLLVKLVKQIIDGPGVKGLIDPCPGRYGEGYQNTCNYGTGALVGSLAIVSFFVLGVSLVAADLPCFVC
jgi:hypothetical protein